MNEVIVSDNSPMTLSDVKSQVNLIQQIMNGVMQKNEHYGVIPGTKKNTLYKSGAEKILMTFRLVPSYEELSVVESDNIISYRIKCNLSNQQGVFLGSGLGTCNSKEKKYATIPIPLYKATEDDKLKSIRTETRKGDNGATYQVLIVPNNPWDIQNTLYKMACKRSLIAATLNVTAASDIFTQDIEDYNIDDITNEVNKPEIKQPEVKKTQEVKDVKEPSDDTIVKVNVAVDYNDKDAQGDLKGSGFKWDSASKSWFIIVSYAEYKKIKNAYKQATYLCQ